MPPDSNRIFLVWFSVSTDASYSAIVVIVIVYFAWESRLTMPVPSSTPTCQELPGCSYSATETCYLNGCIPVICPGALCGGGIVTTTIASYMSSTQGMQGLTLVGIVKIIPEAGSGAYFFDIGSVQYHRVFCKCVESGTCNWPNIPALNDGQRLQVTGTIVKPSTYGSLWAPGGDIYVQAWSTV
jgi:hypothetical protein